MLNHKFRKSNSANDFSALSQLCSTQPLSLDEQIKLITAIDAGQAKTIWKDDFTHSRNTLIIKTIFETAISVHQLLHLRACDIDTSKKHLFAKLRNGTQAKRIISSSLCDTLDQYITICDQEGSTIKQDDILFFSKYHKQPLYPSNIHKLFSQFNKKQVVEFKVSIHAFRLTFAQRIASIGCILHNEMHAEFIC